MRTTGERNASRHPAGHARCFAQAGDRGSAAPVSKEARQIDHARASVKASIEAALTELPTGLDRGAQWLIWSWGVHAGAQAGGIRVKNAGRVAAVLNMLQGLMQWLAPLMQILCAGGRRLATAGGRWTEGGRASGTAWPHRRGQAPAHGPLRRRVPGLDRFDAFDAFAASVARGPAGLRRRAAVQHGLFRSSPAEPSRPDG